MSILGTYRRVSNGWKSGSKLELVFSFALMILPIWWIGWPYWRENQTPGAALEEQALISISADNIRSGFFKLWGIADYGLNGPGLPADKLLYTHFPSGPDVILAVLRSLKISDNSIRHIYILVAISSIPILISLLTKLKMRPISIGLITLFYLFNYSAFWSYSDHYVYAYYFPFLFLGVIGLIKILRREKYSHFLFVVFLTTSYITAFISFFNLVAAAVTLSLFFKSERKKILCTLFWSVSTLFFLHFARNVLALGITVASKDFLYTAGNRIFGSPTKSSVSEFFRVNQIAWWGTENDSLSPLIQMMIATLIHHIGLVCSMAIVSLYKFLTQSKEMFGFKFSKKLEEPQIFIIIAASSLVWYMLFPHQGKNYYFPPMFHSFALFAIIACTLFLENQVKNHGTSLGAPNLSKLIRSVIFFLLVIPSVSKLPNGIPSLNLNFSNKSAILIFTLFFSNVLIFQYMYTRLAFSKRSLRLASAWLSMSAIFLIQVIEHVFSRQTSSPMVKIFFAVGLFLASNFIIDLIFVTRNSKLRLSILISFVLALTLLNCFSLLQRNIQSVQDARSNSFYSSQVKAFEELPRLTGNIWTNINAPLIFRYTGGRVIGYCQAKGLLEKNKKYCASGRIFETIDDELPSYIILVEEFPSGDFACFPQDPCFEKTKRKLLMSHKRIIVSPPGFYIFEG